MISSLTKFVDGVFGAKNIFSIFTWIFDIYGYPVIIININKNKTKI